ncbi:MAG: hypothetical protein WCG45_01195 [bacterium]
MENLEVKKENIENKLGNTKKIFKINMVIFFGWIFYVIILLLSNEFLPGRGSHSFLTLFHMLIVLSGFLLIVPSFFYGIIGLRKEYFAHMNTLEEKNAKKNKYLHVFFSSFNLIPLIGEMYILFIR